VGNGQIKNHHNIELSDGNFIVASESYSQEKYSIERRWCMNKVICNQCVTQFICDVFSKKRLFLIKNHQSNKYNPLIYLYFIHAPTPY
jgi:hypothetical protein